MRRFPPAVSVRQMQRIDDAAISRYHIPRLLLMEHAGQALVRAAQTILPARRTGRSARIVVVCGGGYNGGDGLCAAWHLLHVSHRVRILLASDPEQLREEPAVYLRILRALKAPIQPIRRDTDVRIAGRILAESDLIVDALLGIGLRGSARPLIGGLIEAMNASGVPIVAADVPSGLDADAGRITGPVVRAARTITFGRPKRGMLRGSARRLIGRLSVDDLLIPSALFRRASQRRAPAPRAS